MLHLPLFWNFRDMFMLKFPCGAIPRMHAVASMDNLLLPFIEEPNEEKADVCLVQLIDDHAAPIVREILGGSLRIHFDGSSAGSSKQDAGDLFNDIVANLISRLRQ